MGRGRAREPEPVTRRRDRSRQPHVAVAPTPEAKRSGTPPWPLPLSILSWLGPVTVSAAAMGMVRWTWMGWPDPSFDFGRELHVPWELLQSRVLYRDLAYHNGPLSPYVNGLWFALFGVSLRTVVACNLAIAFGVIALLYRMVLEVASRFVATMACLTFVGLFGFGQLIQNGNFNWLCPYSHEMTHGIALSMLSLWLLHLAHRRTSLWLAAGSGLVMGLVFLTKAEVFVAGAGGAAAGFWGAWIMRHSRGAGGRLASFWCGGLLSVIVGVWALLATAMPAAKAALGLAGSWLYVFQGTSAVDPFLRQGAGLDAPLRQLGHLAVTLGWHSAVLLPAAVLALARRRPGHRRTLIAAIACLAVLAALWFERRSPGWLYLALPLPLFLGLTLGSLILRAWRGGRDSILPLMSVAFAFALLLKMALNARIFHYGFGLAMPATVVWLVVLLDALPRAIRRRGGHAGVFVAIVAAAWLGVLAVHLRFVHGHLQKKTHVVGVGADAFVADELGSLVEDARELVLRHSAPHDTLVCLPDCEILNYLTRRTSPIPFGQFIPHQVAIHGERRMLDAFRSRPPDWIVLVHRDTAEYGKRFFGRDYAKELYGWVLEHNRPVAVVGAIPLRDGRRGAQIMKRVDAALPDRPGSGPS